MESGLVLQGYYLLKPLFNENLLYIQIRGAWKEKEMYKYANYIDDIAEVAEKFDGPFMILADLRNMEPVSYRVAKIHIEAQKILLKNGLLLTGEVISKNQLVQQSAQSFSNQSGMPKKSFISMEHALAWISDKKQKILR